MSKLVAVAQREDGGDFFHELEAAYNEFYAALYLYARSRARDEFAARDAVSETFARALAARERIERSRYPLKAWLFGILRNVIKESFHESVEAYYDRQQLPSEEPGPEETALEPPPPDAIRALSHLQPAEREVVELKVLAELGFSEIAALMRLSPHQVRHLYKKALEHMRVVMAAEAAQAEAHKTTQRGRGVTNQ